MRCSIGIPLLPQWEQGIPAGAQLQITVPYSKDNVVFAVRAYGANGHYSLPVFRTPGQ
jgi:hypothetical protein